MSALQIQRLFPYQAADKARGEQFKLKRWGRRTGKSRDSLHCSVVGHGPTDENGQPKWPGLAQGKHVLWIGPDYTQLSTVWLEEIYPRFNGADGCETNENDMSAWLGDNRLVMRTAKRENWKAMRGMGKNLGGVVIDEGAHMDLEGLLTDVVLPLTLDEDAWIIFGSTPNASHDGHVDEEGAKRTPSYFNILCEQQIKGEMPGWCQSHHDARSNPKISKRAFDRLVATYANQQVKLRQEVYAELLRGGAGFAFPELDELVHQALISPQPIREAIGGMDWGYAKHGWFGLIGLHHRGAHLEWEFPFNGPVPNDQKLDPEQTGFAIGQQLLLEKGAKRITMLPDIVYCDSAMDAVSQGGLSVMQLVQSGLQRAMGDRAPACFPATKGPGSREARKSALHTLLRSKLLQTENGDMVVVEPARFTVGQRCTFWWRTAKALMVDPKHPEDVDTTGPDHAYDGSTYALTMAFPDLIHRPGKPRDPRESEDPLSAREDAAYDEAVSLKPKRGASARVYG